MRPHRRQPTRLPRPWDSQGKNTGVGCHCSSVIDLPLAVQLSQHHLLKWNEVEVAQSCPTLCYSMDCTVCGILQARILELVAVPFSRGSFQTRDQTQVSCIEADSCWRDCLFSIVYSYLLSQTLFDCIYVGLLLGSLFCSIDLFVFVPVPHCFDYCKLCSLKSGRIMPPALFFFPQNCFGNFGPFMVSYKF